MSCQTFHFFKGLSRTYIRNMLHASYIYYNNCSYARQFILWHIKNTLHACRSRQILEITVKNLFFNGLQYPHELSLSQYLSQYFECTGVYQMGQQEIVTSVTYNIQDTTCTSCSDWKPYTISFQNKYMYNVRYRRIHQSKLNLCDCS